MDRLLELYCIAEQGNVAVDCFSLKKREALSLIGEDGMCYIAIDPFVLKSAKDETLKLAHELGHCLTGSFYNRHSPLDVRQKHENKADKWAIEHLIPVDEFDQAIIEGYDEISSLAEYFDVSEDFMRKTICWYVHGNLATELYF